jgi:hypothetical protein
MQKCKAWGIWGERTTGWKPKSCLMCIYIYNIFMFYTHILSKIMHSPNYIYTPNNSRSGPVSGDNSNKQIFILHIFRGNKQIDYRRVRQLSNPLVCRQGRKSAYYPPVTIRTLWSCSLSRPKTVAGFWAQKYGRNTKSRNLASTFETPAFGPMVCRPARLQSLLWFAKFRIYYGRFLALGAKMSVSHYARQHALKWGRVAVKFQRKTSNQALKKFRRTDYGSTKM